MIAESRPRPSNPPRGASGLARFVLAITLVAAAAASFAILFRSLLAALFLYGYGKRDVVAAFSVLAWPLRLALPACGGLLAGALARRTGQGVGDVMEAVVFGRVRLSMRVTLLKSLGSWLAIASGGSVGREGAIIQFGATAGSKLAKLTGIGRERTRILIAAGAAAAFAAAYNTPLAAVLFVLEVVTGVAALDAILPTLAATVLASTLTRSFVGGGPIYGSRAFVLAGQAELGAHAALGLLAGALAYGFMQLMRLAERSMAELGIVQPLRAGLGGLLVGLMALGLPEVTGNGYEPLNALLDGRYSMAMLLLLLVAKASATTASVATGSPGGVFTPSLLLGAALGSAYGELLARWLGVSAVGLPGGYALVGMAAMIAATTHAPIMASVLVFELSGDYAIVLPLLLATAVATALSRRLAPNSIYMAELRRRGKGWSLTLEGRQEQEPPADRAD